MLILVLLAGCKSEDCAVDQAAGTASAVVDGEDWTGEGATFVWTGSSLQINTEGGAGWWMSLVAQDAPDGRTLEEVVDAGDLPVTVALEEGGGGFVTFYGDSGSSYSTNNGGGEFVLAEADEAGVKGCFSFEAATDEGEAVAVDAGTVSAEPL